MKGGEVRVLQVGAEEVKPEGGKNDQDEEQDGEHFQNGRH